MESDRVSNKLIDADVWGMIGYIRLPNQVENGFPKGALSLIQRGKEIGRLQIDAPPSSLGKTFRVHIEAVEISSEEWQANAGLEFVRLPVGTPLEVI